MNKNGLGTEELGKLLLFIAGVIVVSGAVILIWGNLQGPVQAEGVRTKVELAASGKNILFGTSPSAETFKCGTQRVYLNEENIEELGAEIGKLVVRSRYSYGADEQLDFFSDWIAKAFFDVVDICYVCSIVTNSKEFDSSDKLVGAIESYMNEIYPGKDKSILNNILVVYGYNEKTDELSPGFSDYVDIQISEDKPLFVGYALLKYKERGHLLPNKGCGVGFVFNSEDLNNYCSEDYLFIDV